MSDLKHDPKTYRRLRSNLPFVMRGRLEWKQINWSLDDWENSLSVGNVDVKYPLRKGTFKCSKEPQWERSCETCEVTIHELFNLMRSSKDVEPEYWYYFDYKHISQWFKDASLLKDISWDFIGLPDKTGKDSTIWIGSKGAHTPCHMDTYGFNVVAQLYGRKRWVLFPPEETDRLKPSRVPYEESSVYSRINFACGCNSLEGINEIRMVVLEPGDILYVPKNWWHYVENLTTAISVNVWVPVESDHISRLEESLAKCFLIAVTHDLETENRLQLLNPNEEDLPRTINSSEVTWCLNECLKRKGEDCEKKEETLEQPNLSDVPIVTLSNLQSVLKRHCIKCKSDSRLDDNSERVVDVVHLINAFCHPDVLALVRTKLYSTIG